MSTAKRAKRVNRGKPLESPANSSQIHERLIDTQDVCRRLHCSTKTFSSKRSSYELLGLRCLRQGGKGIRSLYSEAALNDLLRRVASGEAVLP